MNTIQDEMLAKQADDRRRDKLGELVRDVWIRWAKQQNNPKPSWLVPYHLLSEEDKEADRMIGEALARYGANEVLAARSERKPQ